MYLSSSFIIISGRTLISDIPPKSWYAAMRSVVISSELPAPVQLLYTIQQYIITQNWYHRSTHRPNEGLMTKQVNISILFVRSVLLMF